MPSGVDLTEASQQSTLITAPQLSWRLRPFVPVAVAIAIYLVFALAIARTKAPWCDEGWFANPAYNLAMHGRMSTNVLEPTGHFLNAYLSGIQQRTYVVVPNHLIALAAWFRIFGFSVFKMRVYSILWGALTFPVLFYLVRKLLGDVHVAALALMFTSVDFVFIWSTADGRMEAAATTLGLYAIAAYVYFRESDFRKAVIVSQVFAATAVFTHPNTLLAVIAILIIAWRFDRHRLRWSHIVWAAIPYCLFALAWSAYIIESPSDFKAQFLANAAGRDSTRWKIILQPWVAFWREVQRHFGAYVGPRIWSGTMNQWMLLIPLGYVAALVWLVRAHRKHKTPGVRMFVICALVYVLGMTFLNGFKTSNYMIYMLPFYNAVAAYAVLTLWRHASPHRKLIAASLFSAFVAIQISTTIAHIRANEYGREYLPAVHRLESYRASGKTIVASTFFGFGMGFEGFRDDTRLGRYSQLKPDVLVVDRSYRFFAEGFETREPTAFHHIYETLTAEYRLTEACGQYWIFEKRTVPKPAEFRLATEAISIKEPGKKADSLFEFLLERPEAAQLEGRAAL